MQQYHTSVDEPYKNGFKCRCPHCGKGKLYDGLLQVVDECPECGFYLKEHDAADGPAYIAMSLIGTLVIGFAILLELAVRPPLWVHMVLWLPITLGGAVYVLRISKSMLISLQYKHRGDDFVKKL